MLSFFMANGRLTPWSLKYNPQALQTVSPWLLRRHSEVVVVEQLAHRRPRRRGFDCLWQKKEQDKRETLQVS